MRLAEKVLIGDVRAAARLISFLEDDSPEAQVELDKLYPHTGKAYIIGVTGAPGTGKSTLNDNLIEYFRKKDMSIGVVAIDPTSVLTGGAILGDRVRMQQHSTDKKVFIRSLATRGGLGGLARAAISAIHVMDAMGKDVILVETVGSGQVEMDIVRAADTTLLVLNPGAGDEIQMLKAGILEAVDVFVVNKADKEGADYLKASLESMLTMKEHSSGEWTPPVILTEAINDKGTEELVEAVLSHRRFIVDSGRLPEKQRDRVRLELLETVEGLVRDFINKFSDSGYLEKQVDGLLKGRTSLHQAAREIAVLLASDIENLKNRAKDGL